MLDDKTITHQRELLEIHRNHLQVLKKQIEEYGVRDAPSHKINDFVKHQREIQELKQYLRGNDVYVKNDPIDEATLSSSPKSNTPPDDTSDEPKSDLVFRKTKIPINTVSVWATSLALAAIPNAIIFFFILSLNPIVAILLMLLGTLITASVLHGIADNTVFPPPLNRPLEILEDAREIRIGQKKFIDVFLRKESAEEIKIHISFPDKEPELFNVWWFEDLKIWAYFGPINQYVASRETFWNVFGTAPKKPENGSHPKVICFINFGYKFKSVRSKSKPESQANKSLYGRFARYKRKILGVSFKNPILVLHRGNVGQKGGGTMSQKEFKGKLEKKLKDLEDELKVNQEKEIKEKYEWVKELCQSWRKIEKGDEILLIGQLDSPDFAERVAKFVKVVATI
ncbi:MAG: hypothetical protein HC875_40795 [Anaerolineales bacterium]|nr:hypothetical protein [Anaerolineales bacterium]